MKIYFIKILVVLISYFRSLFNSGLDPAEDGWMVITYSSY
jgi:hypothetical protein